MLFSRQISQFIAVVRYGSYTRAAEKIAITPSALSHGVRELEKRFGKKLVESKKNGATLTPDGELLYNEIMPLYQQATDVFKRVKSQDTGRALISVRMDGLFYPELSLKLSRLVAQLSDQIMILNEALPDPEKALRDDECDIVIGSSADLDSSVSEGICRVSLAPVSTGLLVSNALFHRYRDIRSLLAKESLIQCSTALNHPIFLGIQKNMAAHNIGGTIIGLPDIADVYYAVSGGLGVSLITSGAAQHPALNNDDLRFISQPFPFEIRMNRGIYFKQSRYDDLIDTVMALKN